MNITPLGVALTGRRVVAVGGGPVAARRVSAFVDDGADVTVVAPQLCDGLADLVAAGHITWAERRYAGPVDLAGAWLVHTATGDASVDAAVAADA
uniref:precorrin-2 dehydrogenase/sirohydrochlorin ferrochelatase family protein n=1 Tax=Kribbia dieselivorans TaxID=331526 RepID=UPI000AFE0DED